MALETIKNELESDKKLKDSSLAKQTYKMIETLVTKPMEMITSFLEIEAFDQKAFEEALNQKDRTLSKLGKYMYWYAREHKTGGQYGMGPKEAAELTIGFFTKPLPEGFLKTKSKTKSKDDKVKEANNKVKEKELKALDISKATKHKLKEYMEFFNVKGTVEPVESQEGLIKVSEEDQMRAFITKHNNKPVKTNKVAKKVVKEETETNQVSLFDEGVFNG